MPNLKENEKLKKMKNIILGVKKEEKNTKDLNRGNKQKEMFFYSKR